MNPNIATANDLTRGQESAVLIKIAQQLGVENIQTAIEMFLRGTVEIVFKNIIDWLGTTKTTPTTELFIANYKFKLNGGICSYIGDNFQSWFKGRIEDPLGEKELRFGKLTKNSIDGPIIEELGGKAKAETTLTEVHDQMSKQSNGEEGNLLVNGRWNIFYVPQEVNRISSTRFSYIDSEGRTIEEKITNT